MIIWALVRFLCWPLKGWSDCWNVSLQSMCSSGKHSWLPLMLREAGLFLCLLSSLLKDLGVELDSELKFWHLLPFPAAVCSIRPENTHPTCDENSRVQSRSAEPYIISGSSRQESQHIPTTLTSNVYTKQPEARLAPMGQKKMGALNEARVGVRWRKQLVPWPPSVRSW